MKIHELYRKVTNDIIRELEQGAAPWTKPWKNGKTIGLMPQNAATGRPYSGINVMLLWGSRDAQGFSSNGWMTFKQAQAKNANVRKGEKGTTVVFTRKITVGEEDEEKLIAMLRTYTVFNVEQIEGLSRPEPEIEQPENRDERLDAFIRATAAEIRHGGNKAAYVPSQDFIVMPPFTAFRDAESYYATILHELVHHSGAKHRLDRDLSGRFGTRSYAAEELVAELGAAFLCAYQGVTGELRHSGYIQSWIELLKNDDRAIFTAASKASQAADFIRSFSEQLEEAA